MSKKLSLNLRHPLTGELILPAGKRLAGYILDQLDVVALWLDLAQSADLHVRYKALRFLHEARFGRAQAQEPDKQEVKEIQVTVKHVGQPRELPPSYLTIPEAEQPPTFMTDQLAEAEQAKVAGKKIVWLQQAKEGEEDVLN